MKVSWDDYSQYIEKTCTTNQLTMARKIIDQSGHWPPTGKNSTGFPDQKDFERQPFTMGSSKHAKT